MRKLAGAISVLVVAGASSLVLAQPAGTAPQVTFATPFHGTPPTRRPPPPPASIADLDPTVLANLKQQVAHTLSAPMGVELKDPLRFDLAHPSVRARSGRVEGGFSASQLDVYTNPGSLPYAYIEDDGGIELDLAGVHQNEPLLLDCALGGRRTAQVYLGGTRPNGDHFDVSQDVVRITAGHLTYGFRAPATEFVIGVGAFQPVDPNGYGASFHHCTLHPVS